MPHERRRQIDTDFLPARKRMNIPLPIAFGKTEPRQNFFRRLSVFVAAQKIETRLQPPIRADELFVARFLFQPRRHLAHPILTAKQIAPRLFHLARDALRLVIEILPQIPDDAAGIQRDTPFIVLFRPDEAAQKRRLPRPVRAAKTDAITASDRKGNIFKNRVNAVCLGQAADFQKCHIFLREQFRSNDNNNFGFFHRMGFTLKQFT